MTQTLYTMLQIYVVFVIEIYMLFCFSQWRTENMPFPINTYVPPKDQYIN